jgi:hypothetical protein
LVQIADLVELGLRFYNGFLGLKQFLGIKTVDLQCDGLGPDVGLGDPLDFHAIA